MKIVLNKIHNRIIGLLRDILYKKDYEIITSSYGKCEINNAVKK